MIGPPGAAAKRRAVIGPPQSRRWPKRRAVIGPGAGAGELGSWSRRWANGARRSAPEPALAKRRAVIGAPEPALAKRRAVIGDRCPEPALAKRRAVIGPEPAVANAARGDQPGAGGGQSGAR